MNTKTKRVTIASDTRNCNQPINHWDEPNQLQSTHVEGDEHERRPAAPWHVVPADNKWFTRLVVAAEVVEALDRLNLKFPSVTGVERRELDKARKILRNSR